MTAELPALIERVPEDDIAIDGLLCGSPNSPSPRSPRTSPHSRLRGQGSGRNMLAGVGLDAEQRAEVVIAAMQRAAERDEVRQYEQWQRERASEAWQQAHVAVARTPRSVAMPT